MFREGLAILLDQKGGGTEGDLTCLWSLEDVKEEKRRRGRKEGGRERDMVGGLHR